MVYKLPGLNLDSTIENLPKIQKPQVAALLKLGINNVKDLLLYFPYRYLDFSKTVKIKDITPGENISLTVTLKSINSRFSFRSRMSLAEAVVSDDTGSLKVTWFNQSYLAQSLKPGDELFLAGKPDIYKGALQLTNPIYEKVSDFPVHTSRLVPLYHLKQELYLKTFRNFIKAVLPLADEVADDLPSDIIKSQGLLNLSQTIRASHFPENDEKLMEAKKRLAFEEIFLSQLAAQKHKMELAKKKTFKIKFNEDLAKSFVAALPFQLTDEQKKAAWQIIQDLEKPMPMNRLLEGDVGSGKTVVALMAALQAVNQELQVVLMAPTEILAKQHFETTKAIVSLNRGRDLVIQMNLLTNNLARTEKGEISKSKLQALIKEGMPGLYIGTHALLAKKVKFKKLALVVIDEQHRFGVEQRSALMDVKGKVPHLLSLTATPIPRSLQLAFYGELDISQIKSKPLGRKGIITKLVEDVNRTKVYEFIKKQLLLGRQAFVITPLIEESETLTVKSAKKELENLQKIFPQFGIGLLHGRMKSADKESIMADFLANKINILVSTSVVEVGVDVPNASVMLIEGAERFGLAQLHQFRGRVGRASHQSYCFLFMTPTTPSRFAIHPSLASHPKFFGENLGTPAGGEAPRSSPPFQGGVPPLGGEVVGAKIKNQSITRLQEFTKTYDGFKLAELDLKQRGFGDIYGSSQSGWNFKYFDPSYTPLIQPAREEAISLLKSDVELLNYPLLKEKIKDKVVHFE